MSSHIARIEAAIRAHILDNEEDFLGSVGGVSELSRRTEEFRNGVRELRRSFMRVRREVSEPHEAVRLRTQQLKNLHAATRLLKRALRFLAALRRLKGQEEALGLGASGGGGGRTGGVADLRELAKAAQSLQVFIAERPACRCRSWCGVRWLSLRLKSKGADEVYGCSLPMRVAWCRIMTANVSQMRW